MSGNFQKSIEESVKISPNHLLHRRQVTDIECNNYKNIKQEMWDFKNKTHVFSGFGSRTDIFLLYIHDFYSRIQDSLMCRL
jgi:hypothetical protein